MLLVGIVLSTFLALLVIRQISILSVKRFRFLNGSPEELSIWSALKRPSLFLAVVLSLEVGFRFADLHPDTFAELHTWNHVLLILVVTYCGVRLADLFVHKLLNKTQRESGGAGFILALPKTITVVVGLLLVFKTLGVEIGPILAALGIGGFAFAFAIQDTLVNILAGLNLLADRAIRVGDLVKLETGQEGTVEDIGWRTSKIKGTSEMFIVPNIRLATGITARKKMQGTAIDPMNTAKNLPPNEAATQKRSA